MTRYLGPRKKILKRFDLLSDQKPKRETKKRKSDYAIRLEERQKLKFIYDITERQFHRYVLEALKSSEEPGEYLLRLLETRLDNVVYRLGFASTRPQARQLVAHGHVTVNGKKVDVSSYHVLPRDRIALAKDIFESPHVREALQQRKPTEIATWIEREKNVGRVKHLPKVSELRRDILTHLIFEFYSK